MSFQILDQGSQHFSEHVYPFSISTDEHVPKNISCDKKAEYNNKNPLIFNRTFRFVQLQR